MKKSTTIGQTVIVYISSVQIYGKAIRIEHDVALVISQGIKIRIIFVSDVVSSLD